MTVMLHRGCYRARVATGAQDLRRARALRHQSFRGKAGGRPAHDGLDADPFDLACDHVLVEDLRDDRLVCCFRLLHLPAGSAIGDCYAAQFYDLEALSRYPAPMIEMGRFCIAAEHLDADILRVAWGAITRAVDAGGVGLLFGCSSFAGTDAGAYSDAFALMHERHLAPPRWRPGQASPRTIPLGAFGRGAVDHRRALRQMPSLLKSYLGMGGWISDHAVIDPDLNTLHVFTGLEIAAIPPARARALRAVAATS